MHVARGVCPWLELLADEVADLIKCISAIRIILTITKC